MSDEPHLSSCASSQTPPPQTPMARHTATALAAEKQRAPAPSPAVSEYMACAPAPSEYRACAAALSPAPPASVHEASVPAPAALRHRAPALVQFMRGGALWALLLYVLYASQGGPLSGVSASSTSRGQRRSTDIGTASDSYQDLIPERHNAWAQGTGVRSNSGSPCMGVTARSFSDHTKLHPLLTQLPHSILEAETSGTGHVPQSLEKALMSQTLRSAPMSQSLQSVPMDGTAAEGLTKLHPLPTHLSHSTLEAATSGTGHVPQSLRSVQSASMNGSTIEGLTKLRSLFRPHSSLGTEASASTDLFAGRHPTRGTATAATGREGSLRRSLQGGTVTAATWREGASRQGLQGAPMEGASRRSLQGVTATAATGREGALRRGLQGAPMEGCEARVFDQGTLRPWELDPPSERKYLLLFCKMGMVTLRGLGVLPSSVSSRCSCSTPVSRSVVFRKNFFCKMGMVARRGVRVLPSSVSSSCSCSKQHSCVKECCFQEVRLLQDGYGGPTGRAVLASSV